MRESRAVRLSTDRRRHQQHPYGGSCGGARERPMANTSLHLSLKSRTACALKGQPAEPSAVSASGALSFPEADCPELIEVAQFWQTRANCGRFRPRFAQLWQILRQSRRSPRSAANSGEVGPYLIDIDPDLAELGRKSADLGPNCVNFGRSQSKVCRRRSTWAQSWPIRLDVFATFGRSCKLGQTWDDLGPKLAELCATSVDFGPISANIGPASTGFGRLCFCLFPA